MAHDANSSRYNSALALMMHPATSEAEAIAALHGARRIVARHGVEPVPVTRPKDEHGLLAEVFRLRRDLSAAEAAEATMRRRAEDAERQLDVERARYAEVRARLDAAEETLDRRQQERDRARRKAAALAEGLGEGRLAARVVREAEVRAVIAEMRGRSKWMPSGSMIAGELNARGITAPAGGQWSRKQVYRVLDR